MVAATPDTQLAVIGTQMTNMAAQFTEFKTDTKRSHDRLERMIESLEYVSKEEYDRQNRDTRDDMTELRQIIKDAVTSMETFKEAAGSKTIGRQWAILLAIFVAFADAAAIGILHLHK
jgi:hypothetical protein